MERRRPDRPCLLRVNSVDFALSGMSGLPFIATPERTCRDGRSGLLAAVSRCSELSDETGQWSIRGLRPKSKTACGRPTCRPRRAVDKRITFAPRLSAQLLLFLKLFASYGTPL